MVAREVTVIFVIEILNYLTEDALTGPSTFVVSSLHYAGLSCPKKEINSLPSTIACRRHWAIQASFS